MLPGLLNDNGYLEEKELFQFVKDGYEGIEHKHARGLIAQQFDTRMIRAVYEEPSLVKIINVMQEIDFPMVCHPKAIEYYRNKYGTDTYEYYDNTKEFNPSSKRKYSILIEEMLNTAEQLSIELGLICEKPHLFNGSYWKEIDKGLFENFLVCVAEKCGLKSFDVRQPTEKKRLLMQFISSANVPQQKINPDEVLINLKNGTYVVSKDKCELREACSSDRILHQLPFDFNPKAQAPMFETFLNEVLPDKNQQNVLFEYLGYVFVKGLKLEKCLLIIGNGANGKSVLFDIVSALLGEHNITSFTLSNLCDDKGYHRAQLTNKLLNYSSELGGKNCQPDMVKKLISTEPVDARSPFGQPFELKNYCKFIFNTNTLPKEVEQTGAYFRRFMIIRFGQTIPEEKQDKELAKKIIEQELSGIFSLVVEGMQRVLVNKRFTYSDAIDQEIKVFKTESNSVALFLEDENYVKSNSEYTNLKLLYNGYRDYCSDSGYLRVSKIEFVRRLNAEDIIIRKGTANVRNVYCVVETEKSNTENVQNSIVAELKQKGAIITNCTNNSNSDAEISDNETSQRDDDNLTDNQVDSVIDNYVSEKLDQSDNVQSEAIDDENIERNYFSQNCSKEVTVKEVIDYFEKGPKKSEDAQSENEIELEQNDTNEEVQSGSTNEEDNCPSQVTDTIEKEINDL